MLNWFIHNGKDFLNKTIKRVGASETLSRVFFEFEGGDGFFMEAQQREPHYIYAGYCSKEELKIFFDNAPHRDMPFFLPNAQGVPDGIKAETQTK